MQTRYGVVLALWAAGLGAAAQFGKVSVAYHLLPDIYDGSGPVLGFAVSLVGFVGIVFGVVAGLLVAQVGFRRALVGALLLGALASAFQAFLPPFWILLISRAIEGASHLAIVVAAPTLIALLSAPKDRGLTLSLWSTFFGVAFALLALVGLPLAHRLGVGALFAAHAMYMAAMAALLWLSLPPDDRAEGAKLDLSGVLRDHLRIYRSPFLSAPALGWLCYAATFLAVLTILPPFLPLADRIWVFALMPLAGIASSMTLGVWLLRRFPPVPIIISGFLLCLICAVALWAQPTLPWAYLALATAMGLIQGASFAAIPVLNPDPALQAQANGALAQMGNVGTTLGTPVLAMLVAGAGIDGFLLFAVVLLGGGGLIHVHMMRRRRACG